MGDFGIQTDQMVELNFGGKKVIDFNILAGIFFSCFLIQKNIRVKNSDDKVVEMTMR
jgi:hypothetical protein